MPVAALPAVAAGVSAASGLAGTGMAIGNAMNQGNNAGTAPIDQSVGQMDPNAFGYGGGIQSPEQQALRAQHQQAQQAAQAAQSNVSILQQEILQAQQDLKDDPFKMGKGKDAAVRMMRAMQQMPQAAQKAAAATTAFKAADQKMQNAPSLAQTEANRYRTAAGAADQRQGVQMDLGNYNETRGDMQGALGLARAAATGNAPSVAQMQLRQGLDQANSQAAGMAAGARGGGGNLALASRAALNQQGQNAMVTNQNAAMLRANEMATARQQYAQTAQGLGQLDLSQSGTQAALDAQQRGLNDARNQYYEGGLQRIYGAQQQGMSGYQQQQANNRYQIEAANRGYADKRFSDQQAANSGALEMGGRAAEGLLRIPGAIQGTQPKPTANPW